MSLESSPENRTGAARPRGPHAVAYVRLGVPDLRASIEFLDYHVGLALEEHDDEHAYLRVGTEHHSVELLAEPELESFRFDAVGYLVDTERDLDELERRVVAAGYSVLPLQERMKGLCQRGFAVTDPNGLTVELFVDPVVYAEAPWPDLRPQTLVHPFMVTDRYDDTLDFYLDVLGFQASDYVEDFTAFLRCEDRYHHSLAVRRADRFALEHLCFIMGSFDGVMRRRARAQYRGVAILGDVVNHSASTSLAFYLYDPKHGPRYELCDGHRVFTPAEHEEHRPRRLRRDPRNIDVWRAAADDRTWAH